MAHNHSADAWDSHSEKWSSAIQSITKNPCIELLRMSNSLRPITSQSVVLDNGAGSGMLTSIIVFEHTDVSITAADISSGMIDTLKSEAQKKGWKNVRSLVADASDLQSAGLKNSEFTHTMGTFFLPFVSDPALVLAEMARVTKPKGIVAVSTWSRISWIPCWEVAVRSTINASYSAPSMFHNKTTEEDDLRKLMEDAGLAQVDVQAFQCHHPQRESVAAAVEEFWEMGNPTIKLLKKDFGDEDLAKIKPAFSKAYSDTYNGVEKRQSERALLAVGLKQES